MNRKIRNFLILLPALLLALSGMIHPLLHSHAEGDHKEDTTIRKSSGHYFTELAESVCPICSGELQTAVTANPSPEELHASCPEIFRGKEILPHRSETRIHNPRAPPIL